MSKSHKTSFAQGFKDFSNSITALINALLLVPIYVIGVGITAITAKLVRKHFLERDITPEKETYWVDLNLKKEKLENYYRQF